MMRRLVAVGAGVLVLILLVLGVRGCLDARKERALENYASDVSSILTESSDGGERFFSLLEDPGSATALDYEAQITSSAGEAGTLLSRARDLDTPDEVKEGHEGVVLALELRHEALSAISDRVATALGREGREEATAAIVDQMQTLLAGDVVYRELARPEIQTVLSEEGIDGAAPIPASKFVPDLTWLDESTVESALGRVSGSQAAPDDDLIHGLGLLQTSANGVVLEEGVPVNVSAGGAPVLEVQVQNQGQAEESDVSITISYGGETLEEGIDRIGPGETSTIEISLTPAPKGQTEISVEVDPVPGEAVAENNSATYTVTFE